MLRSGESTSDFTTKNKSEIYQEHNQVKGFKIDLRFIVDTEAEVDVGCGEVAKEKVYDSKIQYDEAKLVREAKEVVDLNLNIDHKAAYNEVPGWMLQVKGRGI